MWSYIITLIIGAAIPVLIRLIDSKEKQRFYDLEVKEKLRLVEVEKRLEAHQNAATLWYRLLEVIHKQGGKDKEETISQALDFWYNNFLYLESRTRKDFREAINTAAGYWQALEMVRQANDREEKEEFKKIYYRDWDFFMDVIKTIQEEVMLEPIKPLLKLNAEGEKIIN